MTEIELVHVVCIKQSKLGQTYLVGLYAGLRMTRERERISTCDLYKQSNNINAVPCGRVCRTKDKEKGREIEKITSLVHVVCKKKSKLA